MIKEKLSIILALILLVVSTSIGHPCINNFHPQPNYEIKDTKHLEKATEIGTDPTSPIRFEFSLNGYQYVVTKNGMGKRIKGTSDVHSFRLRLDRGYEVVHIFYAGHESDLLLVCEISDGETGAGFITSLDQQTLRAKWWRWIPSFNVGQGLIEEDYAYLIASGFIAKLDLNRGVYVWQHNKLYLGGTFPDFELPELSGDTVLFKET